MKKFEINGSLGLFYHNEEVDIKRCFPSTQPDKYFSVLNKEGEEVLFLEDLKQLDESEKDIIEKYLSKMSFRILIEEIISIEEEFGLRNWKIKTNAGVRSFQTALDNWPEAIGENEVVIEDLNGDRYWIKDTKKISPGSQKKLSIYLD